MSDSSYLKYRIVVIAKKLLAQSKKNEDLELLEKIADASSRVQVFTLSEIGLSSKKLSTLRKSMAEKQLALVYEKLKTEDNSVVIRELRQRVVYLRQLYRLGKEKKRDIYPELCGLQDMPHEDRVEEAVIALFELKQTDNVLYLKQLINHLNNGVTLEEVNLSEDEYNALPHNKLVAEMLEFVRQWKISKSRDVHEQINNFFSRKWVRFSDVLSTDQKEITEFFIEKAEDYLQKYIVTGKQSNIEKIKAMITKGLISEKDFTILLGAQLDLPDH